MSTSFTLQKEQKVEIIEIKITDIDEKRVMKLRLGTTSNSHFEFKAFVDNARTL